jgi:uncharacterized protein YndB with AHSA1/START domain
MTSMLVSRRALLGTLATVPGGLIAASALGAAEATPSPARPDADGISHAAAAIHQEVVFAAQRRRVYRALTDPERFDKVVRLSAAAEFSTKPGAAPTQLDASPGGVFSLFGGYVTGRQVELVSDERIVQVWRAGSWAPGAYSIASFVLQDQGANTRLVFDHKGFPEDQASHLAEGWHLNYWEPLTKLLRTG